MALRGVAWLALYFSVAVAPLIFALINLNPGRGVFVNFSVALGFVGLSMMGLQFLVAARFRMMTQPFGIDLVLRFHREMAFVAVAFILFHPVVLVIDKASFAALLNPVEAPLRAKFADLATVALIVLMALSIWRRRLGMSYERWQMTHAILAVVVVVAALAHVLLVGYYVGELWEKLLWAAMTGAFLVLIAWVRVVRPLRRRNRSWVIAEIKEERGNARSVVLEPSERYRAHGADRFSFSPGEFAWLSAGRSPFAVTQHPFSFSSSAEQADRVTLTIRSAGDFTSHIADLAPGDTVYLDGPYGAFSPDRHEAPGFVLIGGGVGVTPLMSIMRTMCDREDPRPCFLFLGNRTWEDVTFREEIEHLCTTIALTAVHILSDPPEGWEGESGHISAEILDRHLPERRDRLSCFICGPDPMMDVAEEAAISVGLDRERVFAERFGMV